MTKIKEFQIVFENCDGIKFPCEVVEGFMIDGITESVSITQGSNGANLHKQNHAKRAFLKINLNKAFELNISLEVSNKQIPIHERIQNHSDITHFYVCLEDGSEYCVRPPWEGDNQYENPAQKHKSWERESRNGVQQIFCVYYGIEFEDE